MVARTKPGVDWVEIKQRLLGGENASQLAREFKERGAPISATAIRKMAKRRNWLGTSNQNSEPNGEPNGEPMPATPIVARPSVKKLQRADGKRTEDNLKQILRDIVDGCTIHVACERAGMHYDTFRQWRHDEPDVDRALHAACAERDKRYETAIDKAAETDWKAAESRLKVTRKAQYAGTNAPGGGSINVTINIPVGQTPETIVEVDASHDDDA